jgi:hypothetical protein
MSARIGSFACLQGFNILEWRFERHSERGCDCHHKVTFFENSFKLETGSLGFLGCHDCNCFAVFCFG